MHYSSLTDITMACLCKIYTCTRAAAAAAAEESGVEEIKKVKCVSICVNAAEVRVLCLKVTEHGQDLET